MENYIPVVKAKGIGMFILEKRVSKLCKDSCVASRANTTR